MSAGRSDVSTSFISQDVLEPLNDYLVPVLDDFHASYIDSVSYGGKIYAVPWYKACYVMLLNLDQFDKFGVEPPRGGQWTYDEFLAKMKALTKFEKPDGTMLDALPPRVMQAGKQHYGLATNLGPMEYEAYSIIFNAGGRILTKQPDGQHRVHHHRPAVHRGPAPARRSGVRAQGVRCRVSAP